MAGVAGPGYSWNHERRFPNRPPSAGRTSVIIALTPIAFFPAAPRGFSENLTNEMKRTERSALSLRMREGIAGSELKRFGQETSEFRALGLLRKSNDNFVLTRKSKELADSVAEAFL